jgi:hypothetical protein
VTQPVAPGTPPAPAVAQAPVRVAVRNENVYLTSPVTGEVREVEPNEAAQLLQSGWVPNTETGAEQVRSAQIPGEVAAQQSDLGKLGYGVARGVGTPLIDLALPQGSRVSEVLMEDSPWLVGGGEAAGMVGSALLGVGPAAMLEQGAAKVAAGLGAGNGLVRTAFGRSAQGALEGGVYGTMGAISEAHSQNVPLTAQRLGSEILPGLVFGGVAGGLLGGVEGGLGRFAGKSGTLPERIAAVEKGKLDDIFRAGVSDEDALRMAQRELGVKDPGALTRFQALASGGDVTPERLALLKESGAAGSRARADAFSSGDRLAEAERAVLDKGNDYLLGREEAMRQLVGNVKSKHIADMVGAGEADVADVGRLVRDQVVDSGDWAADSLRRERFVDRVLDEMDDDTLRELERTMGASKGAKANEQVTGIGGAPPAAQAGSLRERLLSGLTQGQNETVNALQLALGKMKLSDDALRGFGQRGVWSAKPMEFIEKWKSQLEALSTLPKGVNDGPGDIKKLLGNLEFAEQSVLNDPRRMAAHQLDTLKKRLADFADAGERLGAGSGVPAAARAMYEDLRLILEDPVVWGPKFAGFQSRVNQLLHQNIGVAGEFDNLFVKTIGKPNPDEPWRSARVVDSEKVGKALRDMSEPKQLEQLQRLRDHLDDQKRFFTEELKNLKLESKAHIRIQAGIKQLDQLKESIDTAVYLHAAQRQGKALLGFGPLGSGWEARAALGAVVGGPMGAAAGLGVSAALNPGKMLQFRAIAERMAESTGSRVWRGVSSLLGLKVGDVARGTAGFIGKTAGRGARASGKVGAIVAAMLDERGEQRARTYSQTVKQLIEARERLPELQEQLTRTMPTMEQALPGTQAQMLMQAQRGLDFILGHLPAQLKMRLYGESAAPINDHDYEAFIRQVMAAVDPPSILEMAMEGELTPDAVAAAEYTAPEFVNYMRAEMVRAISEVGPDAISYDKRISASLIMGTPLDESLEPEYIAIQQATHLKRKELYMERKDNLGGGTGGETGVNSKYQSESDRIESGVAPR